ncbi:Uncharacterized protein aq_aa25 [Mucinivorans hirudinis]|uniref:Uncharacterized protein aq_aa25 n=1 Tax=Mucinivorans hirudinis TaxID=1433126 RepID=A0A060REE2_9BACT|nr:Uncharacterized protein aq_aa25 [Mucinivorans hirudinis]
MPLHYNTVTPLLKSSLEKLMSEETFAPFRLVGGTNMSLRYGHRLSDDIDLFTDAEYRSLDFKIFENFLKSTFPFYDSGDQSSIVGFGRSYFVGDSAENYIKVDLMYADPFIRPIDMIGGIRMASTDDIVAMKMNVISRGGRKKDFWDIHYLLDLYPLSKMLELHKERHPWEHDDAQLLKMMTDFSVADEMTDPKCFLGNDWDMIKLDIIDRVSTIQ